MENDKAFSLWPGIVFLLKTFPALPRPVGLRFAHVRNNLRLGDWLRRVRDTGLEPVTYSV